MLKIWIHSLTALDHTRLCLFVFNESCSDDLWIIWQIIMNQNQMTRRWSQRPNRRALWCDVMSGRFISLRRWPCHSQTVNPCCYLWSGSWPASSSFCEGGATQGSSPRARRWGRSGGDLSAGGRYTHCRPKLCTHRIINQLRCARSHRKQRALDALMAPINAHACTQ